MLQKIQSVGVANAPTGTTTNPIDQQRNLYFRGDDEQQDEFVSSEQEADQEKSSGAGKKWAIAGGVLAVVSAAAIGILHHKGAEAFGAEAGEKGFWEKVSKGREKVFGKAEKTVENKGDEVAEDADKIVSKPGTPDHTAEIFEKMFGKQYSEEMRKLGSEAVSKRLELNAEEEELARLKKVVTEAKTANKTKADINLAQSNVDEQQKVVNRLKEEADKADEAFLSKMTKKEFEEFKKLVIKRKEQRAKLEKEIESMTPENAKKAMEDAKKALSDGLAKYKEQGVNADEILKANGDVDSISEEVQKEIGEEGMKELRKLEKEFDNAYERHTLITKMNEEGFDAKFDKLYEEKIENNSTIAPLLEKKKELWEKLANREQRAQEIRNEIIGQMPSEQQKLLEAFEHRADVTKDGKIITVEEAQKAVTEAETKVTEAKTQFDELDKKVNAKSLTADQLEAIGRTEKYTELGEKNLFASDKEFDDFKKILADRKTAEETLAEANKAKTTAEANVDYATILNKPDALNNGRMLENVLNKKQNIILKPEMDKASLDLRETNEELKNATNTVIDNLKGDEATIIKAGLLKKKKTKMETGLKRGKQIETMQDAGVKKLEGNFGKTESK